MNLIRQELPINTSMEEDKEDTAYVQDSKACKHGHTKHFHLAPPIPWHSPQAPSLA